MTNFTNDAKTDFLKLLFENVAWANVGNAAGLQPSSVTGDFWVSMLTADPTDTGSTTNEATYTGYVRKLITRGTAGWTVAGSVVDNDTTIVFVTATGGTNDLTHFGIHTASTGAGNMIIHGALGSAIHVISGITPEIDAGDLDITGV